MITGQFTQVEIKVFEKVFRTLRDCSFPRDEWDAFNSLLFKITGKSCQRIDNDVKESRQRKKYSLVVTRDEGGTIHGAVMEEDPNGVWIFEEGAKDQEFTEEERALIRRAFPEGCDRWWPDEDCKTIKSLRQKALSEK